MNTNMFWKSLVTLVISVMLVGCGGGEDPTPVPIPGDGGETPTYTISGTANPGTKVVLSVDVAGVVSVKGDVSADTTGAWKFTSLTTGKYLLVPSLSGHTCSPVSLTKDINNADWTNIAFTCTLNPTPRNISGWVLDGVGAGVAGVTVSMSPGGSSTTTLADGSYSVGGLNPVQYMVTPTDPMYTFNPLNQVVNVTATDAISVNFTATVNPTPTHSISGVVTQGGSGYSGVTVTATPSGLTGLTDANGAYTIPGLGANTNYSLGLTKVGDTITVSPLSVTVGTADVTGADFNVPVPVLATGNLFYAAVGTQISGDVVAMKDLPTGGVAELWGGTLVVEGYTAPVTPEVNIPSRDRLKVVTQGGNTNGLWVVDIATKAAFQATSGNIWFGECTGWAEGAYDVSPDAGYAIFSNRCFVGATFSGQEYRSIVVMKLDGSMMIPGATNAMRVTTGTADMVTSPVFGKIDLGTGYVDTHFVMKNANGINAYKQVIDPATGTHIGTQTLIISNVVESFRALSCSPDNCARMTFTRTVGGVDHIFVKDMTTQVETDLVVGDNARFASASLVMYSVPCPTLQCLANHDIGTLWAINVDGTGKVSIPLPTLNPWAMKPLENIILQ